MTPQIIPGSLALLLVGVAVYTDLRYGKVFNVVTIPALIIGLVLNLLLAGPAGLASSVGGIGIALALWVVSVACGQCMGGGDIKLLGAIGALCGAKFLLASFVVAAFAGGVLALVAALRRGELRNIILRCLTWGACKLGVRTTIPLSPGDKPLRIPYAFPIAVGVLACMLRPIGLVQ